MCLTLPSFSGRSKVIRREPGDEATNCLFVFICAPVLARALSTRGVVEQRRCGTDKCACSTLDDYDCVEMRKLQAMTLHDAP